MNLHAIAFDFSVSDLYALKTGTAEIEMISSAVAYERRRGTHVLSRAPGWSTAMPWGRRLYACSTRGGLCWIDREAGDGQTDGCLRGEQRIMTTSTVALA